MGKWQKHSSQTRAKRSVLSKQVTTSQQWTDANAWQTLDINITKDPQKKYRLGTVRKNILLEGFNCANLALNSDVDQEAFGKVTKHNIHDSQEISPLPADEHKATRNRHTTAQHTSTWSKTNKNDPQKKHHLGTILLSLFIGGFKPVLRRQPHS